MAVLTYSQVQQIVAANNRTRGAGARSTGINDRLFVCLIWKESGFDPMARNGLSSATGLMQLTTGAVDEVNRVRGTSYTHASMTTAILNVQAGTTYVDILMARNGNSLATALNRFGTGPGYSDRIIECSLCLGRDASNPTACLSLIRR